MKRKTKRRDTVEPRRWTIMRLPDEAVVLLKERQAWVQAFLDAFMRHVAARQAKRPPEDAS